MLLVALCGHLALARLPENNYHYHHTAAAPYHFEYAVNDPRTHDVKRHREAGDGSGRVEGSYSLLEPDGSTRLVEYTADREHGFNARVKKIKASSGHASGPHSDVPDCGGCSRNGWRPILRPRYY